MKNQKAQLKLRMKLLALMLQMKDVVEQRKLEEQSANLHPNAAASAIIGGEFKLSPDTVAVLKELRSMNQVAAGREAK